jgi:hypothetical protein
MVEIWLSVSVLETVVRMEVISLSEFSEYLLCSVSEMDRYVKPLIYPQLRRTVSC